MCEGNRLGHLKVGEARHHRTGMELREIQEIGLKLMYQSNRYIDLISYVKPYISGNLIVSRASGMKFFTCIPN